MLHFHTKNLVIKVSETADISYCRFLRSHIFLLDFNYKWKMVIDIKPNDKTVTTVCDIICIKMIRVAELLLIRVAVVVYCLHYSS